jgi:ligand-binding sensor domain-containing protein
MRKKLILLTFCCSLSFSIIIDKNNPGSLPIITSPKPNPMIDIKNESTTPKNYTSPQKTDMVSAITYSTPQKENGSGKIQLVPYIPSHWINIPLHLANNKIPEKSIWAFSISFDASNNAWIGTSNGLIELHKGKVIKEFSISNNLKSDSIEKVIADKTGKAWVSYSTGNWISTVDLNGSIHNYTLPAKISDFCISPKGTTWVAYSGGTISSTGISYFDKGEWNSINLAEELLNGQIKSITITSDDSLWVLSTRGIFSYTEYSWKKYSFSLLKFAGEAGINIHFLAQSVDGNLWGRVSTTIFQYNGQTWNSYPDRTLFDNSNGKFTIGKDNSIWSGRGFDKNGKTYEFIGLPFNSVFDVQLSPDGSVWYGTDQGLYIYDNPELY